jgi:hypothetical protein
MMQPTYADGLARLVENYMNRGQSTFQLPMLLIALGCSSISYENMAWRLSANPQPEPMHEDLVRQTLLQTMREYMKSSDFTDLQGNLILEVLLLRNRWRICLPAVSDLYDFTVLILNLVKIGEHVGAIREALDPPICQALNEWIKPDTPLIPGFTMGDVVVPLFGEGWYSVVVMSSGMADFDAPNLVRTLRPPFQTGLASPPPDIIAMQLPTIE